MFSFLMSPSIGSSQPSVICVFREHSFTNIFQWNFLGSPGFWLTLYDAILDRWKNGIEEKKAKPERTGRPNCVAQGVFLFPAEMDRWFIYSHG